MPVLRRPHAHCRGLCTRRRTARPALRRWDQDLRRWLSLPSQRRILSPERPVPGTAPASSQRLQTPPGYHRPVLDQTVRHGSTGQSTVVTGFQLSAISPKSSHGKVAAAPNPHRRADPHRFPAGSFFGGFRTPAQLPGPPLAPGRHPKRVRANDRNPPGLHSTKPHAIDGFPVDSSHLRGRAPGFDASIKYRCASSYRPSSAAAFLGHEGVTAADFVTREGSAARAYMAIAPPSTWISEPVM